MGFGTQQNTQQPKRVLIGTPALDGRVDAWYAYALHEIGKLALSNNILVSPVLVSYESILPMARNELFTLAINGGFDCMVFIDSDVYCDPQTFVNVVNSSKEIICIPTVKKSDDEQYDIHFDTSKSIAVFENGNLIKANRVSTSCLKIGKKALASLAENSTDTIFRGKPLKNVCQYDFMGPAFMGEDIYLCEKLKKLGFEIWVDTRTTCMHIGPKVYEGNFKEFIKH